MLTCVSMCSPHSLHITIAHSVQTPAALFEGILLLHCPHTKACLIVSLRRCFAASITLNYFETNCFLWRLHRNWTRRRHEDKKKTQTTHFVLLAYVRGADGNFCKWKLKIPDVDGYKFVGCNVLSCQKMLTDENSWRSSKQSEKLITKYALGLCFVFCFI